MNLVDDVDLETCRNRAIADALDDLARIIDTCMRGGINFQNIDMTGGGDGLARLADAARFQCRFAGAVRPMQFSPRARSLAVEVLPTRAPR